MLYELELENFKPFGSLQKLPLSRITLLYGPNSGGKSSVIQALLLLKQTIDARPKSGLNPVTRGRYVDLGSFRSLVYQHDTSRGVGISVSYDRPGEESAWAWRSLGADTSRTVALTFKEGRRQRGDMGKVAELAAVKYLLTGREGLDVTLVRSRGRRGTASHPRSGIVSDGAKFRLLNAASAESLAGFLLNNPTQLSTGGIDHNGHLGGEQFDPCHLGPLLEGAVFDSAPGSLPAWFTLAPDAGAPHKPVGRTRDGEGLVNLVWQESVQQEVAAWLDARAGVLVSPALEFSGLLESVSYLGPLRAYPQRHHVISGEARDTVGVRGEDTPEAIARDHDSVTRWINQWFEAFDIPYDLDVHSIGDEVSGDMVVMTLTDRRTQTPVSPSDVGFGIGQLLPIIVEANLAHGSVLCVEQPEIHLHPRLQAHLADLFIATSAPATGRISSRPDANQWLIETHSEALMLRLQRRVREGKISADDVSVLYVEPSGKDGSVVIPLRLDSDGEFRDAWPGGFFEEGFRELLGGDA